MPPPKDYDDQKPLTSNPAIIVEEVQQPRPERPAARATEIMSSPTPAASAEDAAAERAASGMSAAFPSKQIATAALEVRRQSRDIGGADGPQVGRAAWLHGNITREQAEGKPKLGRHCR